MKDWILQLVALLIIILACTSKADENRIKIGIIDTGLDLDRYSSWICKEPASKDFTGNSIEDIHYHGTNIFQLITSGLNPNKYCVVILKFYHNTNIVKIFDKMLEFDHHFFIELLTSNSYDNFNAYISAITYASKVKLDYLNLSLGGEVFNLMEETGLKIILNKGTRIIVASGNNHHDLSEKCNYFPACNGYKDQNFYVVGSKNSANMVSRFSNYNGPVDFYEYGEKQGIRILMSGTSQAAANFTNRLIQSKK